ncbi:snRNA-activating protein complex subunit 2 isoform X2 [Mustela erminea]|uniref:snRNA-activating protein complex subunit 2 isoform X2 n=1 Tax=Mustela erminea TaxID=36723 RepID=UPI0013869F2B|nr:snRNA-activating protein complex subunit 2 isoform X2 [Mustela erminea]
MKPPQRRRAAPARYLGEVTGPAAWSAREKRQLLRLLQARQGQPEPDAAELARELPGRSEAEIRDFLRQLKSRVVREAIQMVQPGGPQGRRRRETQTPAPIEVQPSRRPGEGGARARLRGTGLPGLSSCPPCDAGQSLNTRSLSDPACDSPSMLRPTGGIWYSPSPPRSPSASCTPSPPSPHRRGESYCCSAPLAGGRTPARTLLAPPRRRMAPPRRPQLHPCLTPRRRRRRRQKQTSPWTSRRSTSTCRLFPAGVMALSFLQLRQQWSWTCSWHFRKSCSASPARPWLNTCRICTRT